MIPFPVKPIAVPVAAPTDVAPVKPISATSPAPNATQSGPFVFIPGQKYTAKIEERLANGLSTVNIDGKRLHMRLPLSATPGSQVALTLIAQSPRLKFLLHSGTLGGDNPATVSSIGKFITQLLSQAASPDSVVQGAKPLLPAAPQANHAGLSGQLQQALANSGLFYESHLAQWINGKKSLQQLQKAPQGKLPPFTPATPSTMGAGQSVSPQSVPLIQQQLHVLETGTIQWRGEIWPNQTLEWDIAEQPPDYLEKASAEESPRWQTRIRLQLPNLGEITAGLIISAQGLRIQVRARTDEIVNHLKDDHSALISALHIAGLTVQAMEIQQDDQA